MKVCHISSAYSKGGAAIAADRLHKSMLSEGYQSFFLSCEPSNKLCDNSYIRIPLLSRVLQKSFYIFFLLIAKLIYRIDAKSSGISSFNIFPTSLGKFINSGNYDVIFVHWVGAELISLMELNELNCKKIYVVAHDLWWVGSSSHLKDEPQYSKSSLLNFFEKKSVAEKQFFLQQSRVDVICPSKWMFDKLSVCYGDEVSAKYIYNLLPDNFFYVQKLRVFDGKIKISIGTSDIQCWHKGGDLLVPFLKLFEQQEDVEIYVFGNFDNKENYSPSRNITFLGHISNSNLVQIISDCDVYVSLSRVDNLPNIVIESLAVGTFIVGFNVGGLPDIISDEYLGRLVLNDDIQALHDEILNNKPLFSSEFRIQRSVNCFSKFSQSALVKKYLSLL